MKILAIKLEKNILQEQVEFSKFSAQKTFLVYKQKKQLL
jgi:hypothetical protein